jgi:hypothetical protein
MTARAPPHSLTACIRDVQSLEAKGEALFQKHFEKDITQIVCLLPDPRARSLTC